MKEILEKIDFKVIVITIFLIIFEAVIFFLTKPFIQNPFVLGSSLDDKIPFTPYFIWIYIFWYVMLLIVPYYTAKKSITSFYKYAATFIITTIIAGIIFIIFPNTVVRADITGTDIASKLTKLIYSLDSPGINCLPSIHCLFSFLFIFSVLDTKKRMPLSMKIIITILSILVVLSTLFIKQHVIYDAVAAFVIGCITWIIVDKTKIYLLIQKLTTHKTTIAKQNSQAA